MERGKRAGEKRFEANRVGNVHGRKSREITINGNRKWKNMPCPGA